MRFLLAALILVALALAIAVRDVESDANSPLDLDCNGVVNFSGDTILHASYALGLEPVPDVFCEATPTPSSSPTLTPVPSATATAETRSRYDWPFAADSIWNMPIGSGAVYVPAGLAYAGAWNGQITVDREFISVDPSYPLKTINGQQVRVDPNMSHDGSWNGCATILHADGDTLVAGQPLDLAPGGNPSWAYNYTTNPRQSLTGDGRQGCHGGSGLSGLGGSLRPGELSGPEPIRHALKINVWARRFLSCTSSGYRWPAYRADAYMDCTTYGGDVPAMRMGSLVAVLPSVNCAAYSNAVVRKICRALQDYGAYVVDDSYWDVYAFGMDYRAEDELDAANHAQLQVLFSALQVVDNNGPASVGGGGTPRAPLAPPFAPPATMLSYQEGE